MDSLSSRFFESILFFIAKHIYVLIIHSILFTILYSVITFLLYIYQDAPIADDFEEFGNFIWLSIFCGSALIAIKLNNYFSYNGRSSS